MAETSTKNSMARVVKVIDPFTLVINLGSNQGVMKGDQFLIYSLEPEALIDPETGENLGFLEIVKGTGSVTHVQEKMSTIKSNRTISMGKVIRRSSNPPLAGLLGSWANERETIEEPEREAIPFEGVQVLDYVKPI